YARGGDAVDGVEQERGEEIGIDRPAERSEQTALAPRRGRARQDRDNVRVRHVHQMRNANTAPNASANICGSKRSAFTSHQKWMTPVMAATYARRCSVCQRRPSRRIIPC